jgi:hypothetical protein
MRFNTNALQEIGQASRRCAAAPVADIHPGFPATRTETDIPLVVRQLAQVPLDGL